MKNLRFVSPCIIVQFKWNHQPDATIFQFIILTFVYRSTCFGRFSAHHQELNDCSGSLVSWWQSCCVSCRAGRPARPRTQHDCRHVTKVNPEAATAVTELLMMGGRTPETCWAVNKRQDNKLENRCIWLVIYLKCKCNLSLITCTNSTTNVSEAHQVTVTLTNIGIFYICSILFVVIRNASNETNQHCSFRNKLSCFWLLLLLHL